ncbi:MAG: beta-glucosidase [Leptospiraceae bacterium]|nr:beta-glucosidase [Leptospiraceae bacterium]
MSIPDPSKKFIFGSATSSYQIEGAWNEDGKSASIWDTFSHKGKIKDKSNADIACDHYNRFQEDVEIMAQLNLDAYRFSIAWPRVLPLGTGKPNEKGIDFYKRLCDNLLEKSIRPFVTLYHWDLPQILEDKGGWTNRDIIEWFSEYTSVMHNALKDRVKDWIILNEPFVFIVLGYLLGVHAPGRRGFKNFFRASHHAMLAQAASARILRSLDSTARIGTTVSCTATYPARDNEKDRQAARRFDAFYNRFYIDPVVGRGYPMQDLPVLKKIKKYIMPDDDKGIQFDFDFWGINTYSTKLVKRNRVVPWLGYRELKRKLPRTAMGWEIDARGIHDLLMQFGKYPEIKELYITENGAAFDDRVEDGRVHDMNRIHYLNQHIDAVLKARANGVNVNGYFAWSLMDNFEWAEGFRPRFGLVHVDYKTLQRTIKDSGYWYRDFISGLKTKS